MPSSAVGDHHSNPWPGRLQTTCKALSSWNAYGLLPERRDEVIVGRERSMKPRATGCVRASVLHSAHLAVRPTPGFRRMVSTRAQRIAQRSQRGSCCRERIEGRSLSPNLGCHQHLRADHGRTSGSSLIRCTSAQPPDHAAAHLPSTQPPRCLVSARGHHTPPKPPRHRATSGRRPYYLSRLANANDARASTTSDQTRRRQSRQRGVVRQLVCRACSVCSVVTHLRFC